MKTLRLTTVSRHRAVRHPLSICRGVGLTLLMLMSLPAATFEDNFDAAPPMDAKWQTYDLSLVGFPPETVASYTFPELPTGGKAFRMQVLVPPQDIAGPARAVKYSSESYTRFRVAVDLLDWNVDSDTAIGPAARVSNVGIQSTSGYLFNLNPIDQDVDITEVTGELPNELSDANAFLVPARGPYRMEFMGSTDALVGHVYQLSDDRAPIASTAVINQSYSSGWSGLLVFDDNQPGDGWPWTGVDVLYDNYVSEELSATTPPQVMLHQPGHLTTATTIPAPVKVSFFDIIDVVNVVEDSIRLVIDGVTVPNSALTMSDGVELNDGPSGLPGLTASYVPPSAPAVLGGWHTNAVIFQDTTGAETRKEWVFRYPVLSPANAATPGSGSEPGFGIHLVQTSTIKLQEKSLWRAERQLANPPVLPIDLDINTSVDVINFTQKAVPNIPHDGYFDNDMTFPGIDPAGPTDYIALEAAFYLDLAAGTHRLGIRCDDGFQLRSGASPQDPEALVLVESTSDGFDGTVDVRVEQAGVYPFHLTWFEHEGDAHLELYTQDVNTSERILVNAPGSPIQAYQTLTLPVVLESTTTLAGAFAPDNGATVDTGARRITTSIDGSARYYRLRGDESANLTIESAEGGTVVIRY